MQGCGARKTGASQIPRGEPDAWGDVFEAADTGSGSENVTRGKECDLRVSP